MQLTSPLYVDLYELSVPKGFRWARVNSRVISDHAYSHKPLTLANSSSYPDYQNFRPILKNELKL